MSNIQIPNLSPAVALNGTEQYEAVQAGASVRVSTAQLGQYINLQYPPPGVSSIATSSPITGGTIKASGTIGLETAGVTNSYLAAMPALTLKGNVTGGPATPADISASAALDMIGNTRGSLLYRGASAWQILPPGAVDQVLQTSGANTDPLWTTLQPAGTLLPQTVVATSATTTIDWRNGTYCVITLSANTTVVFSPAPPASWVVNMTMLFIQDGTGNWTVTYTPVTSGFSTVYTEDGQQPLINPAANARSELQNILDSGRDELRVRQGVIGEVALP